MGFGLQLSQAMSTPPTMDVTLETEKNVDNLKRKISIMVYIALLLCGKRKFQEKTLMKVIKM